jgi:charged multivesicular body protein 4
MTLENTQVNVETFQALRSGANQMKVIHGQMNVDLVDATMDDIQEEMATADEIGRAISQQVGEVYDEDELEAELREMEELELEEKLLETVSERPLQTPQSVLPVMPSVPSHAVRTSNVSVVGETDEEELEALRQLEASMGL